MAKSSPALYMHGIFSSSLSMHLNFASDDSVIIHLCISERFVVRTPSLSCSLQAWLGPCSVNLSVSHVSSERAETPAGYP